MWFILALLLTAAHIAHAQDVASPLVLKTSVTDADGRITLGDLFDNAGAFSAVVIATRTGSNAILDAAAVQSAAGRAGAYWDNPRGLRRIMVSAGPDGSPSEAALAVAATTTAPATTHVATQTATQVSGQNRDVLVFTHPMNTGDVVQAEDLQFAEVAAASGSTITDAQGAIGKIVRYPLRSGVAIRLSDLTSPIVVKRSEQVQVTWSSNGMSLSMTGTAQKDAAAGDLIQVQNPVSKKLVDAVVTGPGQALAGPAADRLRSNMLLSSR